MDMPEWKIPLSEELLARISVKVTDTDGFPGLVGEIQSRIAGDVLALDEAFFEKIGHYAYVYGKGPWQTLLRDLLEEIDAFSGRGRPGRPDSEVRDGMLFRPGYVWAEGFSPVTDPVGIRREVPLSQTLLERLSQKIVDTGGFPGLVRQIQERITEGVLTVDDIFVDKIGHFAYVYGKGPWQMLLRDVLEEIDAAASRAS